MPTFQVSPALFARGLVAGLLTAGVLSFLWSLVPGFSFWLGLLTGFVTGEAVARASNIRRGRAMMTAAVLAVLFGFLIGYVALGRGAGPLGVLAIVLNPLLLIRLGVFTLISVALAAIIAAIRQRG